MKQVHVIYSGIVQGVGFRYTTCQYASTAGLVGWVRNLPDGRVEVVAEGPAKDVSAFLEQLEEHFEGSISERQVREAPASGDFHNFSIR